MIHSIEINGRSIGRSEPVYVIAEMSANHNQDFEQAIRILRAAREAGADAVKIQTYTADTLTIPCDNEHFRIKGMIWDGRTLHDLYAEAYTPWDWQPKLKKIANELGMDLFSSPFDPTAVAFLEGMDVPAYKIASFEIVDLPLIRQVAMTPSVSPCPWPPSRWAPASLRNTSLCRARSEAPTAPSRWNRRSSRRWLKGFVRPRRLWGLFAMTLRKMKRLAVPIAGPSSSCKT